MWMRKQLSLALACALALNCLWVSAGAAEVVTPEPELAVARATGRFSDDIPANTAIQIARTRLTMRFFMCFFLSCVWFYL